jgi:hypothetical protein
MARPYGQAMDASDITSMIVSVVALLLSLVTFAYTRLPSPTVDSCERQGERAFRIVVGNDGGGASHATVALFDAIGEPAGGPTGGRQLPKEEKTDFLVGIRPDIEPPYPLTIRLTWHRPWRLPNGSKDSLRTIEKEGGAE